MKTIINFSLIFSLFLLPSFGGIGGGNAQDPEIFIHTWYFTHGELDGDAFLPTENLTAELNFYSDYIVVGYRYCEDGITFNDVLYLGGNAFEIQGDSPFLIGYCIDEKETTFMNRHNLIYSDYGNTGIAYNPFIYTLQAIGNYHELTIENDKGDWAVYTSKSMSNPSFNQTGFSLYPNPVNETLHINNTFNQTVQASIYDVTGKLLQSQKLESSNATIDVKSLNQGLYFVILENEMGKKISKKFIKR